jgi:radical SAM protein with 4Fe4S-binding SPASM domain
VGDCACHASDLDQRWNGVDLAFVFLELTPACNNRCIGCSNVFVSHRVEAPLSGSQWIEIVERVRPHVTWVKLTGGEPTLHPDFEMIVAYLSQGHIPFRLLTNGRWPDRKPTLSSLLRNPMLENLLISLHGPDEPSHERFTGVAGSFDDALSTIVQATESGLKVTTSTVITRYNWNRVEEMMQFALSKGVDHVAFNRYIGLPLPKLEASPEQNIHAFRQIERLISYGAPVRFGTPVPQCLVPNNTSPCLAGKAFITVDPWGRVRPCNHSPAVVGHLLEDSLEEILNSQLLGKWMVDIPSKCSNCEIKEVCGAGCRAETTLLEHTTPGALWQFCQAMVQREAVAGGAAHQHGYYIRGSAEVIEQSKPKLEQKRLSD